MQNKKQLLYIIMCVFLCTTAKANEKDSIYTEFAINAIGSTGNYAPFWLHTNKNGCISHLPHSSALQIKIGKEMSNPQQLFDYEFGIAALGMVDTDDFTAFFPELFAAARFYIFDASIGIKPETWGNEDKELSSGGLLFSQNARPLPRITIGISEFRNLPFTRGYVEIKGGITHGWFCDNIYVNDAFLHHKFAGGRIGGDFLINLSYEFHHAAQWGGQSPIYDDLGNDFRSFWNTFLVKSGGTMANDQLNAQGNHIGSHQMGMDIKIKGWKLHAYWQTLFEDGPIKAPWNAMNRPDGLWGCAIEQNKFPFLKKIIYEYINTTDQSGPFHDKDGLVFGGADNYFCNSIYQNGWNYHLRTIGTPFITSPVYNTDGTIHTINNRAQTHYMAFMGEISDFKYKTQISHTQNYGRYYAPYESKNTSIMIEVQKRIKKAWNMDFTVAIGTDVGTQFGNSFGFLLSAKKRLNIISY